MSFINIVFASFPTTIGVCKGDAKKARPIQRNAYIIYGIKVSKQ
jgi:hypothetical protein